MNQWNGGFRTKSRHTWRHTYLSLQADGVKDGDLIATAGPHSVIQGEQGPHWGQPHRQAGGFSLGIPQASCHKEEKSGLRRERKAFFGKTKREEGGLEGRPFNADKVQ